MHYLGLRLSFWPEVIAILQSKIDKTTRKISAKYLYIRTKEKRSCYSDLFIFIIIYYARKATTTDLIVSSLSASRFSEHLFLDLNKLKI